MLMSKLREAALVACAVGLWAAAPAGAAPIVAGTDTVDALALQQIDLFPGTP